MVVFLEGSLVVRVFNFWNDIFLFDLDYIILKRLMEFFRGLSIKGLVIKGFCFKERVARLLKFIINDFFCFIMFWIYVWVLFLGFLIVVFLILFEKLFGLLIFIRKVV